MPLELKSALSELGNERVSNRTRFYRLRHGSFPRLQPYSTFTSDGKLSVESTYVDGKAEGSYVETRNDKPAVTGQFSDDRRSGTWTYYNRDGAVILTATYQAGVLDGPWRQLVDGVVLEGQMASGRRTGTWTRTDKAGVVRKLVFGLP